MNNNKRKVLSLALFFIGCNVAPIMFIFMPALWPAWVAMMVAAHFIMPRGDRAAGRRKSARRAW